ncbi:hypothetical protein LP421_04535 (plasmid) [Rhizobium sp. RCAM05350]|nr:hypothetical protein LP421_04535 [Rhizobium sp. RCAM05350]
MPARSADRINPRNVTIDYPVTVVTIPVPAAITPAIPQSWIVAAVAVVAMLAKAIVIARPAVVESAIIDTACQ